MKKLILSALFLLPLPALAASWQYVVYDNGVLVYEGPMPPVDLTYPPLGQETPTMEAGNIQRGQILYPEQAATQLGQPQLIITPPQTTTGDRVTGGRLMGGPTATGDSQPIPVGIR